MLSLRFRSHYGGRADEPRKRTALGALLTTLAAPAALAEGRQIEEVIVTAERQEHLRIPQFQLPLLPGNLSMIRHPKSRGFAELRPRNHVQPYDATVRGVGRNFRALGGDLA